MVSILLGPARLHWHLSMPQALLNQALGQPLPAPPFSPRLQGTCCVPEVFTVASHALIFLICLPCPASEGLRRASLVHADQATVDAMGSQRAHISTSDLFLAHAAGAHMWPRSTRPRVLWRGLCGAYASPWGRAKFCQVLFLHLGYVSLPRFV